MFDPASTIFYQDFRPVFYMHQYILWFTITKKRTNGYKYCQSTLKCAQNVQKESISYTKNGDAHSDKWIIVTPKPNITTDFFEMSMFYNDTDE